MATAATAITPQADLASNADSWRLHLHAANVSPATVETYMASVEQLRRFLAAQGMPLTVAAITREHIEAFISDLLRRWKPPATASGACSSSSAG
jgi:site-specific recombinase XerD